MIQTPHDYFASVNSYSSDRRLHPLVTFMLMFLANNTALAIFLYLLFAGFNIFGVMAIAFLLLSSVMLYRTS